MEIIIGMKLNKILSKGLHIHAREHVPGKLNKQGRIFLEPFIIFCPVDLGEIIDDKVHAVALKLNSLIFVGEFEKFTGGFNV